nr:GATOR complex protein DEPDC5-like [Leptinotarsa decemlineata]
MDRSKMSQGTQDAPVDIREGLETSCDEIIAAPITVIKSNVTSLELIDAMKHPTNGLLFINLQPNLPNTTFVTADAVNWLMTHVEGVTTLEKGIQKMQTLYKEQLIRHASGDPKKQFVYGFHLFYIVSNDKDDKENFIPSGDLQIFQNDWMEVEVKPPLNWGLTTPSTSLQVPNSHLDRDQGIPHFLCEDIDAEYADCDLDENEVRSDFFLDDKENFIPSGDLQIFQNDWMEVEVKPPLNWGLTTPSTSLQVPNSHLDRDQGIPHFLCEDIDAEYADCDLDGPMYQRMRLETDVFGKSDRVEWGHARYQTVFRPDQAYELIVEWLTSSGSIIFELLFGWHRKAQSCGLQMVPIPHDPLALPYSDKSDPLRGPIFVPLNIMDLEQDHHLFKEFRSDTYIERLFLFQEAILQRFGFISCQVEPPNKTNTSREHQYVHATGTVFVLVSSVSSRSRNRINSSTTNPGRYSVHADVVPSPHEAYITRHVSGKNKDDYDNSRKVRYVFHIVEN